MRWAFMARASWLWSASLALPLFVRIPGCSRQHGHADDEIGKVAATEKTLEESEEDLLAKRGALQRERKKLSEERTALLARRKSAPAGARIQIDDEEASLVGREREILDQESALNQKLDEILRQRADMVQRVTAVAGSASGDPSAQVTRREQGVAVREKDFARREAELARREADVAGRERELGRREREGCPAVAPPTIVRAEPPKGLRYSRHDVEPVYRRALKLMQDKGILASDLPPGTARLPEEARQSMESGDYVRAKYAADQLLESVSELHVDRAFIGSKMSRLNQAIHGRQVGGEMRQLFQEATAAYGDGKFSQANAKINRIYALMR